MSTCAQHVEASNKLIIKFSASSWLILINKYIEMHGQQNIKKTTNSVYKATLRLPGSHLTDCGNNLSQHTNRTVEAAYPLHFLGASHKTRYPLSWVR